MTGILMAQAAGANLIDMDAIQLYPINNPATGNYYFVDYARLIGNALLVNKDGERFVVKRKPVKLSLGQPSNKKTL